MIAIKKAPRRHAEHGVNRDNHYVPFVTHARRRRKRIRFRRTTLNEILAITVCVVLLGGLLHIGIRMACLAIIAIFGF